MAAIVPLAPRSQEFRQSKKPWPPLRAAQWGPWLLANRTPQDPAEARIRTDSLRVGEPRKKELNARACPAWTRTGPPADAACAARSGSARRVRAGRPVWRRRRLWTDPAARARRH